MNCIDFTATPSACAGGMVVAMALYGFGVMTMIFAVSVCLESFTYIQCHFELLAIRNCDGYASSNDYIQ